MTVDKMRDQGSALLQALDAFQALLKFTHTVNPTAVPCTSVTGGSTVRDGDNAYVFRINVPTDVGTYEVYVTRPATTDPWLVERMAPPK